MADRNANLRQSVQNSVDYNRSFQENGLHTLDQSKHSGATDAALFADIDKLVDQQKKDNNNNMDRLRADLKEEVTSTVKTPQDQAVFKNWLKQYAGPAVAGTIGLLVDIVQTFMEIATEVVRVIVRAVQAVVKFVSNVARGVSNFFKRIFG